MKKVLKVEKAERFSMSVLVTDDKRIRKINKKFLNHDYATDSISFWTPDAKETGFLGDIVVSSDTAHRVSKELGIGYREELARYLIHATLHLLGYDDQRPLAAKRMRARQERILKNCAGI